MKKHNKQCQKVWHMESLLIIANNFISSIDDDIEHVMHSKSDNIEIANNDEADDVIKELLGSLQNRY